MQGLKSNVTLNGETLENWQMWCLGATTESDDSPFVSIPPHILRDEEAGVFQEAPGVYNVTFMVDGKAEDTYLKLDQWTKVNKNSIRCVKIRFRKSLHIIISINCLLIHFFLLRWYGTVSDPMSALMGKASALGIFYRQSINRDNKIAH